MLVGPVQVLEHEHGRPLRGDVLQKPRPGSEQLLALGGGGFDSYQRSQTLSQPGALIPLGEHLDQLLLGHLVGVGVEDAGVRLHDLAQRPEHDPLPVGQAAALAPRDQLVRKLRQRSEQLGDEPALAETRLADDRHEPGRTGGEHVVEATAQLAELRLPADKRRPARPDQIQAEARLRRQHAEGASALCLALQLGRLELLELEHVPGRLPGALPDHDLVGRRQPSMRLAVLAASPVTASPARTPRLRRALHPYSRRRGHAAPARAGHELQQPQAHPDRPLRVVLVRGRHAEHHHRSITGELVDDAAVALHLRHHEVVVGTRNARTSSGSSSSERDVKPTRSQNNTVTTRRSLAGDRAGAVRAAPHSWQNFASGTVRPQDRQLATTRP